jgi:hypothetical protein
MGNQIISTVNARACRVCGVTFTGPGVLCDLHRAQLAAHQAHEARKSDAVTDRRIWAEQAARRARARTEIAEAV